MSAITTVIFDMFNTIAQDGPEHWHQSFADIISEQRLGTAPEQLRRAWNDGAAGFREQRIAPGAPFISYRDGWANAFTAAFAELRLDGDGMAASQRAIDDLGTRPLFLDAPEALAAVERNQRLAVVSNADDSYLYPVVARIPARFDAVVSSEGGQCYKPASRLFAMALDKLGVEPDSCVYVGDKQFEDVLGARRAGMAAVWINRKGAPLNPSLPTPDAEIRDLLELPQVLQRLADGI